IDQLAFRVPRITIDRISRHVSGGVVPGSTASEHVIIAVDRAGEAAFLGAAGVGGVCCGRDGLEVGPGIKAIDFTPAVSRTHGISGSGLSRGNAVELIVCKSLRTACVQIVGDAVDVTSVFAGYGIDRVVDEVQGVAAGGRDFDFVRLEAGVEALGDVKTSERRRLADGHAAMITEDAPTHSTLANNFACATTF